MASENVERVRAIYSAWERGDFSQSEWADPAIEVVRPDGMDLAVLGEQTGVAAMADMWRDFLGTWEALSAQADEYRELDDERVLVLVRFSGRGKASGLEADAVWRQAASVFHFHQGRVRKLELYIDAQRALDILGLTDDER